jgi:hypothetical protein
MEFRWYSIMKFFPENTEVLRRKVGETPVFRHFLAGDLYKSLDCFSHALCARNKGTVCKIASTPDAEGRLEYQGMPAEY